MAVILGPDQIMCALKNAGHPLANMMLQSMWELMQTAAVLLEQHSASGKIEGYNGKGIVRTAQVDIDSPFYVFDDKVMIGFTAVDKEELKSPIPFFIEGMDDEGWVLN